MILLQLKESPMGNCYFFKFKTLEARSIVLLLIPVFLILLLGGVVSFFYTRNVMLNQWNESAELKLQRAAHYIAMRISKPLEFLDVLFKKSIGLDEDASPRGNSVSPLLDFQDI